MNKLKYILLLLFVVLQFGLFAQKKAKKDKEVQVVAAAISNEARLKAERLFFDGEKEKLVGNLEEAYVLFMQAVQINPALDAAYYELAQLEQLAGDYSSAQKTIEKALQISPNNMWYLQYLGNSYAAQFKYLEAAQIFHELSDKYPSSYDFYFQEAYFLILNNQLKDALSVYNKLESLIGVQGDVSLQKFRIYSRLNKNEEAVAELEKLIANYPDELEFQIELADFYVSNHRNEEALRIYMNILEIDSNNVLALTSLADYYKNNGNKEEALKYSKLAFANPEIPIDAKISVLYNYIKFYDQKKEEIQEAFELADILIQAHPKDAKAYAIAGDLKNMNMEIEEALAYYMQSLEFQKDIFTVWQQVFFINSDLRDYSSLLKVTNEAKEYFPNQALVYFFNGLAYQQTKQLAEAEKSFLRAVKMSGDNAALKGQSYSSLGDIYNEQRNYAKSDENFELALELDQRNAYVLNNYSYYLSLRNENLDKAAEMSLRAN
ncbi:MAG: tetratricopeptide repeat protein, partial [Bacteroidetes bacterium]|nr:tetratricopeptide repeat protein [Bacteroidota bacterium]